MIVTKQNHLYITKAISNVSGVAMSEVIWSNDADFNLQIEHPEGTSISSVESQIATIAAEYKIAELRKERNALLAETDWWANSDLTMTAEQTAYRQALRDITDTYTSLEDVVWPTKP